MNASISACVGKFIASDEEPIIAVAAKVMALTPPIPYVSLYIDGASLMLTVDVAKQVRDGVSAAIKEIEGQQPVEVSPV